MITFQQLGRYGRLGNQMFQIASTIGIALKNGHEFGFPKWINHDHTDKFKSSEDGHIYRYFKHQLPDINHQSFKEVRVEWGYHDIIVPDQVSLIGYLQSEKYFSHCRSTILFYFQLIPYIDAPFIDEKCVAIHVRRGDYDNKYHPRLGMEYYEKAMSKFPSDSKFYIFSDDLNECRMLFGSNCEYVSTGHYMKDFFIMTLFQNFIIGNSSFSWWPAWLCDKVSKIVVAPSNWFGPAYTISPKDIYCENWIII